MLGLFHGGKLFQVVASPAVIDAFTMAAGLVIMISPLPTLLGVYAKIPSNTFIQIAEYVSWNLKLLNLPTLYVGISVLVLLMILKFVRKYAHRFDFLLQFGSVL